MNEIKTYRTARSAWDARHSLHSPKEEQEAKLRGEAPASSAEPAAGDAPAVAAHPRPRMLTDGQNDR